MALSWKTPVHPAIQPATVRPYILHQHYRFGREGKLKLIDTTYTDVDMAIRDANRVLGLA
jgi:hypothetical protein